MTTPIKTPDQFHAACADMLDAMASPSAGSPPESRDPIKVVAAVPTGSAKETTDTDRIRWLENRALGQSNLATLDDILASTNWCSLRHAIDAAMARDL